jgi:Cytochrome c7 and related cytochrome c/Class III cytochrome C family
VKAPFIIVGIIVLTLGTGLFARGLHLVGVQQGYSPEQPIAFPHKVHAGDNKIPCLYCHSAARTSRHAGIPATNVCMNCHSMLEKQTVEIEKLQEAAQARRAIQWVKVHNLPDFVYFNHSQHVLSGVECQRCHGPIERMDRVKQFSPLTMGWCLTCHREHANLPTGTFERAALSLAQKPRPTAGLDCTSCHY